MPSLTFRRTPGEQNLEHSSEFVRDYDPRHLPSTTAVNLQSPPRRLEYYDNAGSSSSSSSGASSSTGTSTSYTFGSRIDNDEFIHWLEMAAFLAGILLAVTALSFLIYCLVYPLILCCLCVQSEADAFHTINELDTMGPSDSYSIV
jgi:hypothetical protein